MEKAYFNYSQKGYNTIRTFNKEKNVWVNIKKELQPDVVFFTNPHRLTKSQYYIFNFLDCLTCYVPYAFVIIKSLHLHYNQLFQNLLWKAFYETEVHRNFAINIAANNGVNVIVTGYPGIDKLIDKKYTPTTDPWKIKDRKLKRIIWAPHHSIHGDGSDLDYSNFLTYADFMLGIANKYSDKIQIAFKPHPLLKSKLIKNPDWGLNKTEEYYKTWDKLPNGIKNESDYIDLFLTSDAMIHDSASFMVEYLYTQKAVLFMKRDESIENRFNEFGRLVFQNLYQADNETEIIRFIEEKVLLDKDDMEPQRIQFIKNVLIPPHNQSASENIYYAILKELEPN
ncbi:MAG: CDP-glycerol glycerophosphotransferase family protein [Flavobacteriales bacterium]|nr:CDP-glycerol glycerophosphotransferase family protein [Flavobacteriales bacterium]